MISYLLQAYTEYCSLLSHTMANKTVWTMELSSYCRCFQVGKCEYFSFLTFHYVLFEV